MAISAQSNSAHVWQEPPASVAGQGECTLILRGIACRLTREDVKEILDAAGLRGAFSFIYTPRIVSRKSNLGYAFVRFRGLAYAQLCYRLFQGQSFGPAAPNKRCDVSFAKNQGDAAVMQLSRRRQDGEDPGLLFCNDPLPGPNAQPTAAVGAAGACPRAPPGLEDVGFVHAGILTPKTMVGQRCGLGRSQFSPSMSSKPHMHDAPPAAHAVVMAPSLTAVSDLFEDGDIEALDGFTYEAPFEGCQVVSL